MEAAERARVGNAKGGGAERKSGTDSVPDSTAPERDNDGRALVQAAKQVGAGINATATMAAVLRDAPEVSARMRAGVAKVDPSANLHEGSDARGEARVHAAARQASLSQPHRARARHGLSLLACGRVQLRPCPACPRLVRSSGRPPCLPHGPRRRCDPGTALRCPRTRRETAVHTAPPARPDASRSTRVTVATPRAARCFDHAPGYHPRLASTRYGAQVHVKPAGQVVVASQRTSLRFATRTAAPLRFAPLRFARLRFA